MTLDDLLKALDVTALGGGRFRAWAADPGHRMFGGELAAQALAAAGRTVAAGRRVHAAQGLFLRRGDAEAAIDLTVIHEHDGRTISVRRTVAEQHGRPIFTQLASFHTGGDGPDHQVTAPRVPPPDAVEPARPPAGRFVSRQPVELRYVTPPTWQARLEPGPAPDDCLLWMRTGSVPYDEPHLHACLLTYATDVTRLDPLLLRHRLAWDDGRTSGATLSHCLWFHHPARIDRWLLYSQASPFAAAGRGMARGLVFDPAAGTLVASVVQEGLIQRKDTLHGD